MNLADILLILPGPPVVSIVFWLILLALALYIARAPAHRAILSLSRVLHFAFRVAARSVRLAEQKLSLRNREVLLAESRLSAIHMPLAEVCP